MNKLLSHTLILLVTLGFLCQGAVSTLALALAVGQAEVCTSAQAGSEPIVVTVPSGQVATQGQGLPANCDSRPQQPGVNAGLLTLPTLPTHVAQAIIAATFPPCPLGATGTAALTRLARQGSALVPQFRPLRC